MRKCIILVNVFFFPSLISLVSSVYKALDLTSASDFLLKCVCVGQKQRTDVCVCVFVVGVVEERATARTLNERFVLENDDHIQLCENSSCSWLGKRERRQRTREEM